MLIRSLRRERLMNYDISGLLEVFKYVVDEPDLNRDQYVNGDDDRYSKNADELEFIETNYKTKLHMDEMDYPYTIKHYFWRIPAKDLYDYLSHTSKSILNLVELYGNMRANKNNINISNEQMEMMQKILATGLEVELEKVKDLYNSGKMLKLKYNGYLHRYEEAKKIISNMVINWEKQQPDRERIFGQIEEEKLKAKEKEQKRIEREESKKRKRNKEIDEDEMYF